MTTFLRPLSYCHIGAVLSKGKGTVLKGAVTPHRSGPTEEERSKKLALRWLPLHLRYMTGSLRYLTGLSGGLRWSPLVTVSRLSHVENGNGRPPE